MKGGDSMSTFAEAYQHGLTAAEEAQTSVKEINAIFVELNESVHEDK